MSGVLDKPLPPLPLRLPYELWLKIAAELSPEDRNHNFSLNKSFYNLYMDEKYADLQLVPKDYTELVKIMEKLQVPEVQKRVKTLTLCLQSVFVAIHRRSGKGRGEGGDPREPTPHTGIEVAPVVPADEEQPKSFWMRLKNRVLGGRPEPESPAEAVPPAASSCNSQRPGDLSPSRSGAASPAGDLEELTKALVESLTGVGEVFIKYHAEPSVEWDEHRLEELQRFARELRDCAWFEKSNFKYTVQKLSFDVTEKSSTILCPPHPTSLSTFGTSF